MEVTDMFRRLSTKGMTVPAPEDTLPGRSEAVLVPDAHFVNGNPLVGPFPEVMDTLIVGMGCFWGAERFLLAGARGLYHGGHLRRWDHSEPDL